MIRTAARRGRWGSSARNWNATCAGCGQRFTYNASERNDRLGPSSRPYCSAACYSDRGGRVDRTCWWCGKEFKTWRCYVKKGGGKFCSFKCYLEGPTAAANWQRQRLRALRHFKCRRCKRRVAVAANVLKSGRRWCSRLCYRLAHAAHVYRKCRWCGARIEVVLSRAKRHRRFFCSLDHRQRLESVCCSRGHTLTRDNVYHDGNRRRCLTCARWRVRKRRK